jgi:hypothetical protein
MSGLAYLIKESKDISFVGEERKKKMVEGFP